ncbi:MAG TPA: MauE/DoxX family redox-associated membrane protein [Mycobacterium sp.]
MVGVVWAAALLLAGAGLGKVLNPAPTAAAIEAAEIPGTLWLAGPGFGRLIGVAEVFVAGLVLGAGGAAPAALLAVAYLLLTVVARRLLRMAPGTHCGCFGRAADPVSRWHIAVNLACLLITVAAVALPVPGVPEMIESDGWSPLLILGGAVLAAWLASVLMTSLPALLTLRAKVATAQ